MSTPQQPTQRSKRAFGVTNFAQCIRGNWLLRAAGNETTVLCVLLNWRAWVVSRLPRNPLNMPLVQLLQVKCVFRVYIPLSVGGGPNFSEGVHILQYNKFREVLIYQKLVPGGTNFGGSMTCPKTPLTQSILWGPTFCICPGSSNPLGGPAITI